MDFAPSLRAADLTARVADFMATEITPVEGDYHRDLGAARRAGRGADVDAQARLECARSWP